MNNLAAVLPPKRNKCYNEATIRRNQSSLEQMQSMGFSKQRAQKALAATGDKGVQLASDWLLSHVHDPLLDDDSPRQYYVYLCPVGELQKQFSNMWKKSKQCGWNGAHDMFPHITLCNSFTAEDSKVAKLQSALRSAAESVNKQLSKLTLEYFSESRYIGLFVDDTASNFLEEIINAFQKKTAALGIDVKMQSRLESKLHLSLAYQFKPGKIERLEYLARSIDLDTHCRWDLRLYSRDNRISKAAQVRRVIHAHTPSENDELRLIENDFIIIEKKFDIDDKLDDWYEGTSWSTGCSGLFPGNFTERVGASEAWTMHRSYPIIGATDDWRRIDDQQATANWDESNSLYERLRRSTEATPEFKKPIDGNAAVFNNFTPIPLKTDSRGPRQLYVVRHGERIDFTFGKEWINVSFNSTGNYIRHDLNMPEQLPKRNPQDFLLDAPLTVQGRFQCKILGEAFRNMGISIDHVYVSPALRCIETAKNILETARSDTDLNLSLNVEPTLFEYLGWYSSHLPTWMTNEQLMESGFNINTNNQPFKDKLNQHESIEHYYNRSYNVIQKILAETDHIGGNVLVVGHAASLDVCTRQLVGRKARNSTEMHEVLVKIPYCSVSVCQQDLNNSDKWHLIEPPIMTFAHTSNPKYNWKSLAN